MGKGRPRNRWRKHIGMEDLAKIAKAPGRERKLTLVFDQSYEQNIDIEERKFLAEWKLQILWLDHQIHGVAYVSPNRLHLGFQGRGPTRTRPHVDSWIALGCPFAVSSTMDAAGTT